MDSAASHLNMDNFDISMNHILLLHNGRHFNGDVHNFDI